MKKIKNILVSLTVVILLPACEADLLDKTPLDSYSDVTVWSDPSLASAYLSYCYHFLNYGFRGVMLGSVADEMPVGRGSSSQPYNLGTISPDNLGGAQGNPFFTHLSWSTGNWQNVQRINIFLDNIDQIKDNYPPSEQAAVKAKTDVLKGEGLFLRAFVYHNFCRLYGGVPLMSTANKLGDDFSAIKRATFEETVNFIVKDCDDATALLPLKADQVIGRATKEAALALKSRILLFAASDLTADGTAANELVGYANPDRTALWTAAKNAAKAVMDLGTAKLVDFGAPDQAAVANNYFRFFMAYTLASDEVIWGRMFLMSLGQTHRINQTNGPNGINNFGRNGPLQSMVDEYEMRDGSKFFDHFEIDAEMNYKNISTVFGHESPYYNREPRFYANVLYDSAQWQQRPANLQPRDPLGIYERRTHRTMNPDGTFTDVFGLDTRKGPLSPGNGCYGGYLTKKFMDITSNGDVQNNQNIWIYMRYAEVLLNYAEACLELGETDEAAMYINMIRNRAALPDFTGDIKEALRHERKIELYGEESRWYDIRRWKILIEAMTPLLGGIDILEIKNLDGTYTTTWKWIKAHADNKPEAKLYWIPIGTTEMKKAPQLIQNPGY